MMKLSQAFSIFRIATKRSG